MIFSSTYINLVHHILILHSSVAISSSLVSSVGKASPGVPSPRELNSGLPYSKPTHYHLTYAAPKKKRAILPFFNVVVKVGKNLHTGWSDYIWFYSLRILVPNIWWISPRTYLPTQSCLTGAIISHTHITNIRGASKIKLKNVYKKRIATARRLFFLISQGIHCWSDYTVFFIITKLWRPWWRRQRR